MAAEQLKQLITVLLDGVVDNEYEAKFSRNDTHVELQFDKADLGRVIGKGGRTAAAIRQICHSVSEISGDSVSVAIDEKSNQ